MTAPISRRAVFGVAVLGALAACSSDSRRADVNHATERAAAPTSAPPTSATPTIATPVPTPAPSPTVEVTAPTPQVIPPNGSALVNPPAALAPPANGPAAEFVRSALATTAVGLTFHGGGDLGTARAVLRILADRGATCSVMAIGVWLQANPQMAAEIITPGHDLGNHTWSHPANYTSLAATATRDEIVKCRDLIRSLTGQPGAFFRPSSTQYSTPLIRQSAWEAGYPVCLSYDIDTTDWTDASPTAVRAAAANAQPGSILSLHFGHQTTVVALPLILDDLAARGLRGVAVSQLLAA